MKSENRLLAAVMFTDMVGYTAMMQENEPLAKSYRDRHRHVLQHAVKKHEGKIVQFYGDGTLMIFNSAVQAVDCAINIQKELHKEPLILLRIGIHSGDIIYSDNEILGDGVNIASRIENLAMPGSILISDKLADEVKNHPRFQIQSLGHFNLKNVKHQVEVFALANEGLIVPKPREISSNREEDVKTIAVLPFINMSSDPENEYFSDGITEEILNALSKVEGLLVTARTSSFAFKGKNLDAREIGKLLTVKTILEGSVRKAGNKVRITAQLIKTADGYHIWSETFDRELKDIFAIQDEISLKICNRLREKLAIQNEDEKLVIPSTRNIEAYNIYLKGLFYQNKWTLIDSRIAISLLTQAIEMDPGFAQAYAELSTVYGFLGASGKLAPKIAFPQAKDYARKAQMLDDHLAETYLALANVYFWNDWNWKAAVHHANEAIKRNPSYADAYQFKALYLTAFRKFKEALVCLKISLQLDPLAAPSGLFLSIIYYNLGQYEKAVEQIEQTLSLNPDFPEALNMLAWHYTKFADYEKAIAIFERIKNIPGNEASALVGFGGIYIKLNKRQQALDCLQELLAMEKNQPDIAICFYIAMLYCELGDPDNMFIYFNKAIANREGRILMIGLHQEYLAYCDDPRFTQMLEKIGLEFD